VLERYGLETDCAKSATLGARTGDLCLQIAEFILQHVPPSLATEVGKRSGYPHRKCGGGLKLSDRPIVEG
jgi:hypothetical protein